MGEFYLGEVRMFSFGFPPKGWALCNGQLLAISQNQALFAILGTTYGGDRIRTFALPNLQGRIPYHFNNSFPLGSPGGEEFHQLSLAEIPLHNHAVMASSATGPDQGVPTGNLWVAQASGSNAYAPNTAVPKPTMSPSAIAPAGGNQGHENRPPYLTVNFCIALTGIFPSRS